MANENLKNALRTAGMTAEQFAEVIQVDPKSVQRWVTGSTVPYRRHRAAISRALNLSEHDLWSEQNDTTANLETDEPGPGSAEVVGTWGHTGDPHAPDLVEFIRSGSGSIDVLDSCCGIEITPEAIDALRAHADAGRSVRILTDGSAPRWELLLNHDRVELYLTEIPGECWLIKTGGRMLVTINLEHHPADGSPPMLELTTGEHSPLFDRLAARFDELWALATGPDVRDRFKTPAAEPPPANTRGPGASPPRRWPGETERAPGDG